MALAVAFAVVMTVVFMPVIAAIFTALVALVALVAAVVPIGVLLGIAFTHPLVLHKVDRLAAGVVAAAVDAPLALMHRRHVEVDRLPLDDDSRRRNQHRLWQHERGCGQVADVDAAVDAWLVDSIETPTLACAVAEPTALAAIKRTKSFFMGFA